MVGLTGDVRPSQESWQPKNIPEDCWGAGRMLCPPSVPRLKKYKKYIMAICRDCQMTGCASRSTSQYDEHLVWAYRPRPNVCSQIKLYTEQKDSVRRNGSMAIIIVHDDKSETSPL